MSENIPPEESLADEFRSLGKNLVGVLQAAWEKPERKRIQTEIETNLKEMADAISREFDSFAESGTAQRLKDDVNEFGERVRSAEMQEKLRSEVMNILQNANNELKKVIDKWSTSQAAGESATPPAEPVEES